MNLQNEVILATDFLEHSDAAKNAALQLAEFSHARLQVVHVCDDAIEQQASWAMPWAGAQTWVGDVMARMQREAKENLETFVKNLPNVCIETTLLVGNPPNKIKSYLKESSAEVSFVVLAKRRRSYFEEFLLGSVAHKTIQQCTRPTLIIPDDIDFSNWCPKHIVVALSLADGTRAALEAATQLAKYFDAKVTLLHTIETSHAPYSKNAGFLTAAFGHNDLEHYNAEYFVKNELTSAAQSMQMAEGKVQIEVRYGLVIESIFNCMAELKADLLVTGSHATGGTKRKLLGSIPSTLAHSAHFPLLVVRHEGLTFEAQDASA